MDNTIKVNITAPLFERIEIVVPCTCCHQGAQMLDPQTHTLTASARVLIQKNLLEALTIALKSLGSEIPENNS